MVFNMWFKDLISSNRKYPLLYLLLAIGLFQFSPIAHSDPIYVYKKGKAITFSSRPPVTGVETKVFTGRGSAYSTIKAEKFSALNVGYSNGGYARYRTIPGNRAYSLRLNSNPAFDKYIKEASTEFGVDKSLIRAVIHAESGFNPRAVSPKGAQGLMQLMPGTARMHGVRRAFEPRENIRGGTRHLAQLLRRYRGNLVYSIAAYNAGEGAVEQYGGIPPYTETRQYVSKVLALQSRYKNYSLS